MIKKGFDLFEVHSPLLYSRGFGLIEPMCCDVCKFCFFHIGRLVCKYRDATYNEAKIDRLSRKAGKKK